MKTSEKLLSMLMVFEGLRLTAYEDAAGVLTIGYGHTKGVRRGDTISDYYAKELLKQDVAEFEEKVKKLGVARTEGQLDALVSFVFNLGIGNLKSSTLLKTIQGGGSMSAIKREFKRWVYAGGKQLPGLVKRREWEARRFFE